MRIHAAGAKMLFSEWLCNYQAIKCKPLGQIESFLSYMDML